MRELYPFEGHFLEVEGGHRLHYLDEGEGPAVVMVHGNPTWSFYYRNLVSTLSDRFRTIAPDHIGCGRSDKPDDDGYEYTLTRRVADLDALIRHTVPEGRLTLVMHDWGGMIAMAWAAQHPERVDRLVVMNTAAFHMPDGKSFPGALTLARMPGLSAILVRGFSAFSKGAIRTCMTRHTMPDDVAAGYLEPYDSWRNRIAVHRFVEDIPLGLTDRSYSVVSDTQEALEGLLERPMLLCWGMKDFVFDHNFLEEWERRFPDAEVHRFDDAGHYILEDAAEDVIPLVEGFLDRGLEA